MRYASKIRATLVAMDGERVVVQCMSHRDALREFHEYKEWLANNKSPLAAGGVRERKASSAGSCPNVRFDTHGEVIFTSRAGRLNGVMAETIVVDERDWMLREVVDRAVAERTVRKGGR